jgi:UDP-N-acetylglucosamine 2-epimerase (non-hydrolysing)
MMHQVFFKDLKLPEPDIYLGAESANLSQRIIKIIEEFEKFLRRIKKVDLVVVFGDVDSTLLCALAAAKLSIRVVHVEAGLRSFDMNMPEEINRVLTDSISDYLFTPSIDANENLRKEGFPVEKIFMVGNIMIDTLLANRRRFASKKFYSQLGLKKKNYAVLTLHRPSNVDNAEQLTKLLTIIEEIQKKIKIVFPAHPRTSNIMVNNTEQKRLIRKMRNVSVINPVGYLEFMNLLMNSRFVLTDSGGVQEEATVLNIPCLTLRDNTERPVTVSMGTNTVLGDNRDRILKTVEKIMAGEAKQANIPPLWDGKTAARIVKILLNN